MPTTLIIIGITGDLSRRYLLPAIEQIAAAGELPADFRIVGTTRRAMTSNELLRQVNDQASFLSQHLEICQLDPTKKADYVALGKTLERIERTFGAPAQRLFYLSVPPQVSWPVVELLGASGLSDVQHTKLLLEKPFGTDLESADQLIAHTNRYFDEKQVYRIDHYLAKEMAQNLIVFREANPLLRHTWHKDFIERIDITVAESIDIEGRASFYEQTGALRDVMQSHGLQLAALTLMAFASDAVGDIPRRRLGALRQLHIPADHPNTKNVVRGQYEGYRAEVANPDTTVETFVRLILASSDPRWEGVPICITTGKALPEKQTIIRVTYRSDHDGLEPNRLTLRIQPDAGIELELWTKVPGYTHKLEKQALRFTYDGYKLPKLPDAYEQVLVDAIRSNHTLFASSDEVRESWRILMPVQDAWAYSTTDLVLYPKGGTPAIRSDEAGT